MSEPAVPSLHCPMCRAEITESAPFAFCSRCSMVMHDTCVRDNKCPHCSGELVNLPGRTLHLIISGSSAQDVTLVARSLLAQTQVHRQIDDEKTEIKRLEVSGKIRDLTVVDHNLDKRISILKVDENVKVEELIIALANKLGLPTVRNLAVELLFCLGMLLESNEELTELLSERLGLSISVSADMLSIREDITFQDFIKLLVSDKEILAYFAQERSWPVPISDCLHIYHLTRGLSHKELPHDQTLKEAGIEDGETLIFDVDRVSGGGIRFYSNGNLKEIKFEPDEASYIIEVLRELQRLRKSANDPVTAFADNEQRTAWREQLATHRKNLHRLEIQLAKFGSLNAPLWLLNQIEDEKVEIKRLEDLLRSQQKA